jgi:hypothetical protein
MNNTKTQRVILVILTAALVLTVLLVVASFALPAPAYACTVTYKCQSIGAPCAPNVWVVTLRKECCVVGGCGSWVCTHCNC